MAIFKRGKMWWIRFTAPNGQRIRQSTGTTDRKAAQHLHDKLKAEIWEVQQLGNRPQKSWQDAVIRWLDEKSTKADIDKDRQKLIWLHQYLGNINLDEISKDRIDQIASIKKEQASPSTANRYLALIRSILRAARDEWEWIDRVPAVRLYSEPKRRIRYLTEPQAIKLISFLPSHLADLAAFTLSTGLRQSNASYLMWEQVDLARRVAWIHADQSKSRKAFTVPLNEDAIAILKRLLSTGSEYVFTYKGKPVARTSTKAWYKGLERAEISDFRWHDLRHTWASWHVQNGTSLQELQELGGWSCYEMVLRYAHLSAEHLKTASERISGTNLAQRSALLKEERAQS